MKYRHAFHAGNFADVHKHVTLNALLRALARKDKGFLLLDTHAGRGGYDLSSSEAHRGHEAEHGIERLIDVTPPAAGWPAEISDYLTAVQTLRRERHDRAAYPGSPLLALLALRAQDRAVFIESQPGEHAALREAVSEFARYAPASLAAPRRAAVDRATLECADGYGRIAAWLPPIERRALVLIDPPYEDAVGDQRALAQALDTVLARLPSAVVAVWYPIKDQRATDAWIQRLTARLPAPPDAATMPWLVGELCVHPPDSRVGLNGSGMLVLNPPWRIAERMREWLPVLHHALDPLGRGGWTVREGAA
ncbi:MAG: 23S rRNA (adenine(2030)-N(6))-methyltransferase RlmJ [Gammaproteobacteria bacterium]|nr:23S rRNA (adenine(2030)-N(6))-methyltransferase RlmJ [Gammaproteobacteria bacterium]